MTPRPVTSLKRWKMGRNNWKGEVGEFRVGIDIYYGIGVADVWVLAGCPDG